MDIDDDENLTLEEFCLWLDPQLSSTIKPKTPAKTSPAKPPKAPASPAKPQPVTASVAKAAGNELRKILKQRAMDSGVDPSNSEQV